MIERGEEVDWFREVRLDLDSEPSGVASAYHDASAFAVYDARLEASARVSSSAAASRASPTCRCSWRSRSSECSWWARWATSTPSVTKISRLQAGRRGGADPRAPPHTVAGGTRGRRRPPRRAGPDGRRPRRRAGRDDGGGRRGARRRPVLRPPRRSRRRADAQGAVVRDRPRAARRLEHHAARCVEPGGAERRDGGDLRRRDPRPRFARPRRRHGMLEMGSRAVLATRSSSSESASECSRSTATTAGRGPTATSRSSKPARELGLGIHTARVRRPERAPARDPARLLPHRDGSRPAAVARGDARRARAGGGRGVRRAAFSAVVMPRGGSLHVAGAHDLPAALRAALEEGLAGDPDALRLAASERQVLASTSVAGDERFSARWRGLGSSAGFRSLLVAARVPRRRSGARPSSSTRSGRSATTTWSSPVTSPAPGAGRSNGARCSRPSGRRARSRSSSPAPAASSRPSSTRPPCSTRWSSRRRRCWAPTRARSDA